MEIVALIAWITLCILFGYTLTWTTETIWQLYIHINTWAHKQHKQAGHNDETPPETPYNLYKRKTKT